MHSSSSTFVLLWHTSSYFQSKLAFRDHLSLTTNFHRTKGKTLEQMDILFGDQLDRNAVRDSNGAAIFEEKNEALEQVESRTEASKQA
jgi:hypothetical protein